MMILEYHGQTLFAGVNNVRRLTNLFVETIWNTADSLASACLYMLEHGVLHLDLKGENLLFSKQGEPIIVDYGIVRRFRSLRKPCS